MTDKELPCGCTLMWNDQETTLVFCSRHIADYFDWKGTDSDFVKMVATPKKGRKKERLALLK